MRRDDFEPGRTHKGHSSGCTHIFPELLAQHGDETFYAFVLYTDEDCYTVVPAANSLEQYRAKVERTDPRQQAHYKWASAEWAYESFAADSFDAICEQLSEACAYGVR